MTGQTEHNNNDKRNTMPTTPWERIIITIAFLIAIVMIVWRVTQ